MPIFRWIISFPYERCPIAFSCLYMTIKTIITYIEFSPFKPFDIGINKIKISNGIPFLGPYNSFCFFGPKGVPISNGIGIDFFILFYILKMCICRPFFFRIKNFICHDFIIIFNYLYIDDAVIFFLCSIRHRLFLVLPFEFLLEY